MNTEKEIKKEILLREQVRDFAQSCLKRNEIMSTSELAEFVNLIKIKTTEIFCKNNFLID